MGTRPPDTAWEEAVERAVDWESDASHAIWILLSVLLSGHEKGVRAMHAEAREWFDRQVPTGYLTRERSPERAVPLLEAQDPVDRK